MQYRFGIRWTTAACIVMGCLFGTSSAFAQTEESPLHPGIRIRVVAPTLDPPRRIGTILNVLSDSLRIVDVVAQDTLILPWNQIDRLEVSTGRKRKWLRGAIIGALVGGGITVALTPGGKDIGPPKEGIVALGVAAGVLWGGIIGSFSRKEQWLLVSLPQIRP